MKKKVIWGAGIYGGRFSNQFESDEIAFFIDQDIKREGEIFCGKRIRHNERIGNEEWQELFVYVPENYYEEIKVFLEKKNMFYGEDFCKYSHNLHISEDKAEREFLRYKKSIDEQKKETVIPIFATYWRKHGYVNYFENIRNTPEKYLLINEVAGNEEEAEYGSGIMSIQAPLFADYETIINCEKKVHIQDKDIELLIEEETDHMRGFFPEESIKKCRYSVWMKYKYIEYTLERLKCKKIICFSSVTVEHSIIKKICNKYKIQTVYTHPGIIHGTLSFDVLGEVGESVPAVFSRGFRELPVSDEEIENARCIKDYLIKSRLNRKVQPKSDNTSLRLMSQDKPIVMFAGQNDVGSYMVPFTETTRQYYSPNFRSSIEAAVFVAEICERNGWNFIYKPHPMYVHPEEKDMLPPSTCYIDYADINDVIDAADVVVTILSTTNYDAVVRDKPVVVLGYMQSKGKGFNYEAFRKEEIERAIQKAVQYGMTDEMKRNFIKHLAQCLKYYLYDNGMEREIRYGLPFPDSFDGFFRLYELLKDKNTVSEGKV